MICPECYAEYFTNAELCGDCKRPLVEASLLDMPIPEMKWIALPYFEGKVYSDMITEIFDERCSLDQVLLFANFLFPLNI